jgi:hypothetical protein
MLSLHLLGSSEENQKESVRMTGFWVRIEPRVSETGSKNANHNIMIFVYIFLVSCI